MGLFELNPSTFTQHLSKNDTRLLKIRVYTITIVVILEGKKRKKRKKEGKAKNRFYNVGLEVAG